MTTTEAPVPHTPAPAGLDLETARQLFGEMEPDAEPDFSLIETYYHPQVRFRDPIQALEGREAFIEMSRRLASRCRELRAQVNDAAQTGNIIMLQWTMEMKLGPTPLTRIEGCTKLTLDERGHLQGKLKPLGSHRNGSATDRTTLQIGLQAFNIKKRILF